MQHSQKEFKETVKKPVGLLARWSHRDKEILSECPQDDQQTAAMMTLVLLMSLLIRASFISAALTVVNLPLEIACAIGISIAIAIAAVDRMIMQGIDLSHGEKALHKSGGTDQPQLTNGIDRWWSNGLRLLAAVIISTVTAGLVAIYLHAPDIGARVEEEQVALDAPIRKQADVILDEERGLLVAELDAANALVDSSVNNMRAAAAAGRAEIATAEREVERLEAQANKLRANRNVALDEERRQRDLARCENAGDVPSCEAASGVSGKGKLYDLAIERADAAAKLAEEIRLDLLRTERQLVSSRSALRKAKLNSNTPLATSIAGAKRDREKASLALSQHDQSRSQSLNQMIAEHPARNLLDEKSLAVQIWALGKLAQDPWFAIAFFGIKLAAFLLEILPLIACAAISPAEYVLLRARRLTGLKRDLRTIHDQESISDAESRVAAYQAREQVQAETRPITQKMRRWQDEIRAAQMEGEALRKRRSNEWFAYRTNANQYQRNPKTKGENA